MDVDEFAPERLQLGEGSWGVVDKGTALSAGKEFAADNAFVVVLHVVLIEEGL